MYAECNNFFHLLRGIHFNIKTSLLPGRCQAPKCHVYFLLLSYSFNHILNTALTGVGIVNQNLGYVVWARVRLQWKISSSDELPI